MGMASFAISRATTFARLPPALCFNCRVRGLVLKAPKSKVFVNATYNDSSFQPLDYGATNTARSSLVNQPGQDGKVYVSHAFFKGKAGLILQPKAPEFSALDTGGIKLSKAGVVFIVFVPAIGTRQYDWSKKQVFALSVVELGTLLSLDSNESCEFFHDPSMGTSEEGKVRKILKVSPLQDRGGYSFILSVSNRNLNVDDNLYVPITKGEFAVMRSAFNFILPHLMGWHAFANSPKPDQSAFSVWQYPEQDPPF
ncbi:hypothetical protein SUGI_0623250 [Cryptomeria japonica]|uniref:single-stranded DNA-binding protein WHY1, chloroplastic isoform X2 n=1 Tax=Cryptomeria japonica TaxID=3369 RepID=UPI002414CCEE|nr:single-stranded DNA-binding protein WHY1, chloroplastic isoform X2 [Cryptomeria japonica]GLJ31124.1 hypothetical protein SUGI_0623250 [Cryptomeria japonica]